MALAETAKLVVDLSLKGNFARSVGTANRALSKLDASLDHTESRAYRAGQQIGTGIKRIGAGIAIGAGIVAVNVQQGLDSLIEVEKQQAQTNAVIKSTGGIAGVSADEVRKLAESYESLNATIGDETIQNAENLLLGFTNIRKKAFEPALLAALNLNTRLGGGNEGLAGTVQLLGKALNNPEKGLGALSKRGITFDKQTVKRIKNLQKEGKLYEAQNIILGELNKRYGGAFAAEGGTTAAKVGKFRDAIEDLQRTLAAGLLPVVSNIADALTELFADPQVQAGVKEFGENLAKLLSPANIKQGIGAIKDVFTTIAAVAGPAATAVRMMVDAFSKLPPDLRNLLIGAFAVNKLTGGLVTNIAGGLIGALKNIVVPVQNVRAGVVNVAGGAAPGGVPGAAPAAAKGGLSTLGKVFLIGEAIGLVAAVNEVRQSVQDSATQQAQAVGTQLSQLLNNPNTSNAQLLVALDGVNQGIRDLQADPLAVALVSGPALAELQNMKAILQARLQPPSQSPDRQDTKDTTAAVQDSKKQLAAQIAETKRETSRGVTATNATKGAVNATKAAVQVGDNHVASTVSSSVAASTGAIVGAIWAARPVVNVTAVNRTTTVNNRYGSGNGSQGNDSKQSLKGDWT